MIQTEFKTTERRTIKNWRLREKVDELEKEVAELKAWKERQVEFENFVLTQAIIEKMVAKVLEQKNRVLEQHG